MEHYALPAVVSAFTEWKRAVLATKRPNINNEEMGIAWQERTEIEKRIMSSRCAAPLASLIKLTMALHYAREVHDPGDDPNWDMVGSAMADLELSINQAGCEIHPALLLIESREQKVPIVAAI